MKRVFSIFLILGLNVLILAVIGGFSSNQVSTKLVLDGIFQTNDNSIDLLSNRSFGFNIQVTIELNDDEFEDRHHFQDDEYNHGNHIHPLTEIEFDEYRDEISDYYSSLNEEFFESLSLSNYLDVDLSENTPFIQLTYETLDHFRQDSYLYKNFEEIDQIKTLYISEEAITQDSATRNTSSYSTSYNFSDVLSDVGLSSYTSTGNSIRVGIIESGTPNNLVNLTGKTYELHPDASTTTAHSFQTSSIIGGTSGIAQNVSFSFVPLSNVTNFDAIDWLVSTQKVHVINRSNSSDSGNYTWLASYYDSVIKNNKVTIVNSAGNDGNNGRIGSPSTGQNVISVASSDSNSAMSYFSSAGLQTGYQSSLRKPTITAPGGRLTGISNVSGSISGTSFSAPVVTGIVALLMQEFPQLKTNPHLVMSTLTASATTLTGQASTWDYDGGAGLVNYGQARSLLQHGHYESGFNYNGTNGTVVSEQYLHVPANKTVKLSTVVLFNSTSDGSTTTQSATPISYTQYQVKVYDGTMLVAQDDFTSNVFLINLNNSTGSTKYYKVQVIQVGTKNTSGYEYISFAAYLHNAPSTYYIFKHTYHVVSSTWNSHNVYCNCGYDPGNYHTVTQEQSDYCIYCGYDMKYGIGIMI